MARKTSTSSSRRRLNGNFHKQEKSLSTSGHRGALHDGDENNFPLGDTTTRRMVENNAQLEMHENGKSHSGDDQKCARSICFCYLRRGGMFLPPPTSNFDSDNTTLPPFTVKKEVIIQQKSIGDDDSTDRKEK